MSLNEIIELISRMLQKLPFGFADGVIVLSLVGFLIVEATYSVSIVLRRLVVLVIASLVTILSYRLAVGFIESRIGVFEGILEGVSVLFIWMLSYLLAILIVRKDAFMIFEPPGRLRVPMIGILGTISFLMLSTFILHIFVSLPFPRDLKRFLTGSFIAQKTLAYSHSLDSGIQKTLYRNNYDFLHVRVVPESEKVDFRFIPKSPARDMKTEENVAKWIIGEREKTPHTLLAHEYVYSNAAQVFAKKVMVLGNVGNMSEDMSVVFSELGIIHPYQSAAVYLVADSSLIIPVMERDRGFKSAIGSGKNSIFGISVFDVGTNGWLVVVIFGD